MSQRLAAPRRWRRRLAHGVVAALAVLFVLIVLDRCFPLPLPDADDRSVVVTAADGTPLRAFAGRDSVWRYPVAIEDVSPLYVQALVGYEDRWFWRHPGVNPFALLRAGGQWLRSGHVVSGGSTLSMQVARILEPQPRNLFGKTRQVVRALQFETHLSKREILTLYLNHAPFGGTIEGVEAASWAYLGKPSRRLSHAEAALLSVLPQSPSRLRPDRNPDAARKARDKVLVRLAQQGVWSERMVSEARIEPVASRRLFTPMLAPLLAERLRRANPGRARIRSTLDADLQRDLEARVSAYAARLPERSSAALLVVDNRTSEARAYVGSLAFADTASLGHVDMVPALRSPGSTLKPFLYGLALDDGLIHSESLLLDVPQSFGDYRPTNFDPTYNGPVSAADALRLSLNVPAVDLLDRLGPARFAARLEHAGVKLALPAGAKPNLSMILGGAGVSLEQLVGAYAAFHREGLAARVSYVPSAKSAPRRLLSPGAAWIIRDILERRPEAGTAEDAFDTSHRRRIAWKTGTSYGFRDAWALGSADDFTVGVWIGRPDGTPMPGQYGAITALPLLLEVMDALPRERTAGTRAAPATVRQVEVCWPLGLPADATEPELCRAKRQAWALVGSQPPSLPERDARVWSGGLLHLRVDADSGMRLSLSCSRAHRASIRNIARWPSLATPWLSVDDRQASAIPPLAADCEPDGLASMEVIRIDGVAPGSTLARAPGSAQPAQIRLRALGANGRVNWLVNGALAGKSNGGEGFPLSFPVAGDQRITALADSGAWAEIRLRVLR